VCIKSKITCKPLPKESREWTKALGKHIYTDVWGPFHHTTINNKYYYISFTDDYSRESVIYLMKNKSKAFKKYKLYEVMMKMQWNVKIKSLVSDQGGEYTSHEFKNYLDKQGTAQKITVHDTPKSNGIAERLNWTLVKRTHAMLIQSKLSKNLWGYALLHANYIKNHTYLKALPDKLLIKWFITQNLN
jgi:transposase InsO family protein